MSAASQTKIFGVRLGLDPKILVGILIAFAGLLFWYNSRGDDTPQTAPSAALNRPNTLSTAVGEAPQPSSVPARRLVQRRSVRMSDNGVLKLRPVDATKGDVDPTLHLELLARVQRVQPSGRVRNLFDVGATPVQAAELAKPIRGPVVPPRPLPPTTNTIVNPGLPVQPQVEIPLKFYGFVKPLGKGLPNRGLFLDGDNIVVASEGELVKQRYLLVEVNANTARMEDTHLKQGQTLPVVPEARAESN